MDAGADQQRGDRRRQRRPCRRSVPGRAQHEAATHGGLAAGAVALRAGTAQQTAGALRIESGTSSSTDGGALHVSAGASAAAQGVGGVLTISAGSGSIGGGTTVVGGASLVGIGDNSRIF